MQAGVSLLILDVMPIYMIIALDIVIIICFSINFPIVICLPAVCYSQEKPLVKTVAPESISYHILKPKIPCCNFLLSILFCIFVISIYQNLYNSIYLNTVEGFTNPSFVGLQVFIVCVHVLFT